MKNLMLILLLSTVFLATSCSKKSNDETKKDNNKTDNKSETVKDPKAHCKSAMDNVVKIMLNSPEMKKMAKEKFEEMKKSFEEQKAKRTDKCVEDYNKDAVDCVIVAQKMSDLRNCNAILNKSKKIAPKKLAVENPNDKKADCIKAIDHTTKITLEDPKTKETYKGKLDKLKEGLEKQKPTSIERCLKNYNKKSIECTLKAKTLVEIEKCP